MRFCWILFDCSDFVIVSVMPGTITDKKICILLKIVRVCGFSDVCRNTDERD